MNHLHRTPDYLVLGHVAKDLVPGGSTPGGTVTYASITAQRLGMQAAIVTACAPGDGQLLDLARSAGVWVHAIPSPGTTTFRNMYDSRGHRTQVIGDQASALSYDDVPEAWRAAPIVHLGPIAQELPAGMPADFPRCLLGVTPQGWMRSWDDQGHVAHSAWPVPTPLRSLPSNALLVLSVEDLGYDPELIDSYVKLAPLVAVTQEARDAYICSGGECTPVPACSAHVVDPTGAGDVFAAALFIRLKETGDLRLAARFAHAAAACAIEGEGTSGIAERRVVEQRLVLCT